MFSKLFSILLSQQFSFKKYRRKINHFVYLSLFSKFKGNSLNNQLMSTKVQGKTQDRIQIVLSQYKFEEQPSKLQRRIKKNCQMAIIEEINQNFGLIINCFVGKQQFLRLKKHFKICYQTFCFIKYFIVILQPHLYKERNNNMRPNFKLYHSSKQTINQIDQSREIDVSFNHNQNQRGILGRDSQRRGNQDVQTFSSNKINGNKAQDNNHESQKKYSTNEQTKEKYFRKIDDYNSGKFNSTQAASPYHKFSSDHFKEDGKSIESIKKQLIFEERKVEDSQKFKLSESKLDTLAFTFKKKVQEYPRAFGGKMSSQEELKTFLPSNSGKDRIKFEKISFQNLATSANSKENDSSRLNGGQQQQISLSSIRKRIDFEKTEFEEQNPIIRQINEQIRRDREELLEIERDYKISRRNQKDLVKRKILESRSQMGRFYEQSSQNVQYEYRKAKFMDIFLGSKALDHHTIR